MARLFDRFSPLFALCSDLADALDSGRPHMPHSLLQRHLLDLMDDARRRADTDGVPVAQFESASFAVVAWLDELMARMSGDPNDRLALQTRLFNSSNAQTEFFHHLAALQPGDEELREVYWQVLMHGFKGAYYFEQDDSGVLGKLKALHAPSPQPRPHASATQTPAVAPLRSPRARSEHPRLQSWRLFLMLALMLTSAAILWRLWSWSIAPRSDLAARIDLALQSRACADLTAYLGVEGKVKVSGFVASPDDMVRVKQDILALPGVRVADFDLQLRVWPHCEVVALLQPYRQRNREAGTPMRLTVPSAREGRLREGDPVIVQVERARDTDAIQVDCYLVNGAVMHLVSAVASADGKRLELGRDMPSSWLTGPPFGEMLITAVSSTTHLRETAGRPPFEMAPTYLLRLRQALAASDGSDRLRADYLFVETVSR